MDTKTRGVGESDDEPMQQRCLSGGKRLMLQNARQNETRTRVLVKGRRDVEKGQRRQMDHAFNLRIKTDQEVKQRRTLKLRMRPNCDRNEVRINKRSSMMMMMIKMMTIKLKPTPNTQI